MAFQKPQNPEVEIRWRPLANVLSRIDTKSRWIEEIVIYNCGLLARSKPLRSRAHARQANSEQKSAKIGHLRRAKPRLDRGNRQGQRKTGSEKVEDRLQMCG